MEECNQVFMKYLGLILPSLLSLFLAQNAELYVCLIDNQNDMVQSNKRLLQLVLNTAYGVDTFFVLR
jgi:hypothetical protein